MIRKACAADTCAVAAIYEELHSAEERGEITVGWQRGVYPVRKTAEDALARDDLFVLEEDGIVKGAAIINRRQVDVYDGAAWEYEAEEELVCVLHTLVISPRFGKRGLAKQFIRFYEAYALGLGCPELRLDTNERNHTARSMYAKLGYKEIGIVPTVFNGIQGVQLVLLEKWLGNDAAE